MLVRAPFEYYLRHLITRAYDDDAILERLSQLDIEPKPSSDYLAVLRSSLADRPTPFIPETGDRRSLIWLAQEKISGFFVEPEACSASLVILTDPRLRRAATLMTAARILPAEVASKLELLYNAKFDDRAIMYFRHYFANFDLMTPASLRIYAKASGDEEVAAAVHGGRGYALWRLSVDEPLDHGGAFRGIARTAYARYMELSAHDNKRSTAESARVWASIVFESLAAIQATEGEVKALIEASGIRMKLLPASIPGVEDATEGYYSGSAKVIELKKG